jgi:PAS domain S-box-containing protein
MVSKIATFRLPEDLTQEIRSRAEATGRDRTAVVIEALKQAFGLPLDESRSATVEELQQQLGELEEKFSLLSEQLKQLSTTLPADKVLSQISPTLSKAIASDRGLSLTDSLLTRGVSIAPNVALSEGGRGDDESEAPKPGRGERSLAEGKPDDEELQALAARIEQQARIFDQVLSASPDPICVLDRMGRFTYVNLAIAQLFGLQQGHILGRTWQELDLPAEVMEPIDAQREVVFATRRPLTNEISFPTLDGIRDYECILSPILGVSNNVEAVICTARDITERNQVEAALRESEANYRHLFEDANDSIFIIDLSTSRIMEANQNAARRLGYTRKELLQLRTRDIDVPISEACQRQISQQLQATGSIIFDHALRRKDGAEVQVEISSRIIEYRDQLVSLSFVRDITARQQAEERLRLLESVVKNTSDGVFVTDARQGDWSEAKILYVNSGFTHMTGYSAAEAMGRTPRLLQGTQTDPSQLAKITAALSHQKPIQVELLNYRKDGSEFWVELTVVPIADKKDRYTHWVAVQHDITERKKTETLCSPARQMNAILESMTDGFLTVDAQWQLTYANPKAAQILQTARGKLVGQRLWKALPEALGSEFEGEYRKALAQQMAVKFDAFHPAIEKWFEVQIHPDAEEISILLRDISQDRPTVEPKEKASSRKGKR